MEHCQSCRSNDNDCVSTGIISGNTACTNWSTSDQGFTDTTRKWSQFTRKDHWCRSKSGNVVQTILRFLNHNKNGKNQWHKKPQIIIKLGTAVWWNQSTQQSSFTFTNHIPCWITLRNYDYTKNMTTAAIWCPDIHVQSLLESESTCFSKKLQKPVSRKNHSSDYFHISCDVTWGTCTHKKAIINWWCT